MSESKMVPREPTRAMVNAGEKRRREIAGRGLCIGTIWCAMYDAWAQEQTSGAAQAATDGPAADPIADLCAELRELQITDPARRNRSNVTRVLKNAADAIERLTAERDALRADRDSWRDQASDRVDDALKFANEADALRAERDALRAANLDCVAHYEDARADAERWQRLMLLWAASTELTLAQTDDGRWSITQVEAVDEPFPQLVGDTPTAAIDAARGKG